MKKTFKNPKPGDPGYREAMAAQGFATPDLSGDPAHDTAAGGEPVPERGDRPATNPPPPKRVQRTEVTTIPGIAPCQWGDGKSVCTCAAGKGHRA